MSKKTDKDDHVNVFSKGFTGGPLGLGDPNDKSLRHVEEHVFITQIIKDRAHHEKCHDLIKSKPNHHFINCQHSKKPK